MSVPHPEVQGAAEPLWRPSPERCARARITAFTEAMARERGLHFDHYEALWQWSVTDTEGFWSAVITHFDLPLHCPPTRMLGDDRMPGAQWLPGARLNLVDQVMRHRHLATPAIVAESEAAGASTLDWPTLVQQVGALSRTLQRLGVQPGDRVAGYLPNIPQTVVAFLACASIGAVWALCSPDMGPDSVVDRLRQIEPAVLFTVDGYRHGGRPMDRRAALDEILGALPSVRSVVWIPHLEAQATAPEAACRRQLLAWPQALAESAEPTPLPLPADHPLWVLYSSGTTGLPKAIVHGHGGVLVNGMVNMVLHSDLHPGDRVLWAVNTSWMVWNAHVLGLLGGATLVLFDGAVTGSGPAHDWGHLWRLAGRLQVNVMGVGAAIHQACLKAGVVPRDIADLAALHTVCSTGSPLSPEASRWIFRDAKTDVWLNTVSGGTDIAGGFLVGLPTLPVYLGEMQCRTLGARVEVWNDAGQPVMGEVGELVCTRPLPSMPIGFWGDTDQVRYTESYFDSLFAADGRPVWRHGDWLRLVARTEAVGGVILGRSDATINRQGVRMGTAELYRVVESVPEVLDSLVVDLEHLGRESCLLMFVQLRPGEVLDAALDQRLRLALRTRLSARHVPDEIIPVEAIPKTITGKKLELPIKKLLLGHPVDAVLKRDALAPGHGLDWYVAFAASRQRPAGIGAMQ